MTSIKLFQFSHTPKNLLEDSVLNLCTQFMFFQGISVNYSSCSIQLHTKEINLSTPFVLVEYPNLPFSPINLKLHQVLVFILYV